MCQHRTRRVRRCQAGQHRLPRPRRAGLSMIELLIATSIMAVIAGALGALAMSVQAGNQYSYAHSVVTQHGRVALERIQRTLAEATASEQFPGFIVIAESVSPYTFPDALVVWHPAGSAADPDGLPLISELVVFCPNPQNPSQLWEITIPGDNRPVPPVDDAAAWNIGLAWAQTTDQAQRVVLTDLLHTAATSGGSSQQRGAVRFEVLKRPSDAQWQAYQDGTTAWEDLPWVQDIYGTDVGLRQSWCRIELLLTPPLENGAPDPVPFFGSAAVYYQLRK